MWGAGADLPFTLSGGKYVASHANQLLAELRPSNRLGLRRCYGTPIDGSVGAGRRSLIYQWNSRAAKLIKAETPQSVVIDLGTTSRRGSPSPCHLSSPCSRSNWLLSAR
jgi:hypothetical protein